MMQTASRPAISAHTPMHFKLLKPLLSRYMGTEPKFDHLNRRNAHRWYWIVLESLENGDHERMYKAMAVLTGLATVKRQNRGEAREYLARIMKNPGATTYASDMLQNAASNSIRFSLQYAKDPEAVYRTLFEVMTGGMGPMQKIGHLNGLFEVMTKNMDTVQKLRFMNTVLAEQLLARQKVPKEDRARAMAIYETSHKLIGELLAQVKKPDLAENPQAFFTMTIVSTAHMDFAEIIEFLRAEWGLSGITPSN